MVRELPAGVKRGALNGFIAFNLAGMVLWGLPECNFTARASAPFRDYVLYCGLWHTWGMFAPTPFSLNYDLRAKVTYRDGSVAEWLAPRMEELSILGRMPKERYRKWREGMFSMKFPMAWNHTARFIARQMDRRPANPPVEVVVSRFWEEIPPPNKDSDFQPMPKRSVRTNSYTFVVLPINPQDLQ